jgi:hypothetical protein
MIKSKFISDIVDLLLDGDAEGITARPQIQYLTDEKYDYTGGGLFVSFSHTKEIGQYKSSKHELILNGVKITTSEFPIEADATLFFINGIIGNLEIWCYLGDYPNQDLTKYTLTQIWNNSPGRQVSTEDAADAKQN